MSDAQLRMDARLSEEDPQSAARFYGFTKTARAIADLPLDGAKLLEFMCMRYADGPFEQKLYPGWRDLRDRP